MSNKHKVLAALLPISLVMSLFISALGQSPKAVSVMPDMEVRAGMPLSETQAAATIVKMSPYMKECAANGVTLPPRWGEGSWRQVGTLPREVVLAGTDPITEIWTYRDANGVCYALPRKDSSGEIKLLGIICESAANRKACFWDNFPFDSETRIVGSAVVGMDPADIQGGDLLQETCTDCHRGNDVFFITPDTPLEFTFQRPYFGTSMYEPIARPGWSNDPGTLACGSCHAIPKLTDGYCRMLQGLIGTPPDELDPIYPAYFYTHAERARAGGVTNTEVAAIVAECNSLKGPADAAWIFAP